MLVVDLHALQAVDLLDLVHQVLGGSFSPLIFRMSCGLDEPSISGVAGAHAVALVHADVLALGDQVLARLALVRRDDDLALAAESSPKLHRAVDLG